jgi:uncharacterized protein YukE
VRTTWNGESRPEFHAEHSCQLHLAIAPLVVALEAKSELIFEYADFFSPSPRPLSTAVRTAWKGESRPEFLAEHACQLHLAIAALVLALGRKSRLVFEYADFFSPPQPPLFTTIRTTWNGESRPEFHAESTCGHHLSLAPLVVDQKATMAPLRLKTLAETWQISGANFWGKEHKNANNPTNIDQVDLI